MEKDTLDFVRNGLIAGQETQPKVVLLAEDDHPIREIVAEFLVESGFPVLQVADAAQALEMLRESSHKMIFFSRMSECQVQSTVCNLPNSSR